MSSTGHAAARASPQRTALTLCDHDGMPAATLTREELNRATLARQMLLAREKTTALKAVERLAGLQAQLARPPFIGLWSRLAGFRPSTSRGSSGSARWSGRPLMRGTLHLMSAKDYLVCGPLLQPMLSRAWPACLRDRAKGLDIDALVARRARASDGEPRTFDALRDLLEAAPEADERAMAYAVRTHLPAGAGPGETCLGIPGGRGVRAGGVLASEKRLPTAATTSVRWCCVTSRRSARRRPGTPRPGRG